jgi:hypothetical protein
MTTETLINPKAILRFLTNACDHYEKTAPTVHAYCDDLYTRMQDNPVEVRALELFAIGSLLEDGVWEQPNYAANRIYHLQERLGQATVGHAGF